MGTDSNFDEMDLPLANPNEELETISKTKLQPLFDVRKFEIRFEDFRDKGIDLHIELKKDGRFTNFRFAIQLKATETKPKNADNSVSIQIHTSNINYLLNNTMPAYYVLYFKDTNTFYYESLNLFIKQLSLKDPDWQKQGTHTLRFEKKLTESAVEEIYKNTLDNGLFHRKVNELFIYQADSSAPKDRILIDKDLKVSSDEEIRSLIEKGGQLLINEGRWKEVIDLHQRGSGNIATSSLYNLVLGIATYYSGNLLNALSFFKAASKLKSELTPELQDFLSFFLLTCKSSLGLISQEQYRDETSHLENAYSIGLYVKLDQSIADYHANLDDGTEDKFEAFVKRIDDIITDPKADHHLKAYAKSELLVIQGSKNNMDNVQGIASINAFEEAFGPSLEARKAVHNKFITSFSKWYRDIQKLLEYTLARKNYFQYFTVVVGKVKVIYEMQAFSKIISVEQSIPGRPDPEVPDIRPVVKDLLKEIDQALRYYKSLGHIENQVVALVIKYELNHFIDQMEEAESALQDAENLIETYELTDKRRRLEHLKKNGTTYENFKKLIDDIFHQAHRAKEEIARLIDEMKQVDEEEKNIQADTKSAYVIDVFPIGTFSFPKHLKSEMFEILRISKPEVVATFNTLLESVIPVANIYYPEITEEGFRDGKMAGKSVENWRNIHRVRMAFHENKFYRIEQ